MFHIYGMVVVTYTALVAGAKLVTIPKFEPQLYIDTFSNYKVSTKREGEKKRRQIT